MGSCLDLTRRVERTLYTWGEKGPLGEWVTGTKVTHTEGGSVIERGIRTGSGSVL